jgi:hypothetical protein
VSGSGAPLRGEGATPAVIAERTDFPERGRFYTWIPGESPRVTSITRSLLTTDTCRNCSRQQGKFVLIKATEVAETFDSYQDALTAGCQHFKLDSFLVKQINPAERVTLFSPRLE